MNQNQNSQIPIEIHYPPLGSLIHIDKATELTGFCPNSGTLAAVVDENTYGIILSHDSLEYGVSVEVMIGNESWNILHKYIMVHDRETGYWPFVVISDKGN